MTDFSDKIKIAREAMRLGFAISGAAVSNPCEHCFGKRIQNGFFQTPGNYMVTEGCRSYIKACEKCNGTGTSLSIKEICRINKIDEDLARGLKHDKEINYTKLVNRKGEEIIKVKLRRYFGTGYFAIFNDGKHFPFPPCPHDKEAFAIWQRGYRKFLALENSKSYKLHRFLKNLFRKLGAK